MRGAFLLVMSYGLLCSWGGSARSDVLFFDFSNGPGPNFSAINTGDMFTLDLDGPDFRVAKPADSGVFEPRNWIYGGIQSGFTMLGDFTVTVDFTLNNFPINPAGTVAANESFLQVIGNVTPAGRATEAFSILRYTLNGGSFVEDYGTPSGAAAGSIGSRSSSLTSGRYRIQRVGGTLTGYIAAAGSSDFSLVASLGGYSSSAYQVVLAGNQGPNVDSGLRSTTALDVSFDNLLIQAQALNGVVPEPASMALFGIGGLIAGAYAFRTRSREGNEKRADIEPCPIGLRRG